MFRLRRRQRLVSRILKTLSHPREEPGKNSFSVVAGPQPFQCDQERIYSAMRKRHRVVEGASTTASGIVDVELHRACSSCENDSGGHGPECSCSRSEDGILRRDSVREERQAVQRTPSFVVLTIGHPASTRTRRWTTSTAPTSSPRSFSSITSSASSQPSTHTLSPRSFFSSSSSSSTTHSFTPTGIQAVVPTYPPSTTSSSNTSTTTNWSAIGTKLGLCLGIPLLVLLTLLLVALLHRRQARRAKEHRRRHHPPEMATTPAATDNTPAAYSSYYYPRLHPVPSSRLSTAGDIVVTPAPGLTITTTTTTTTPTPAQQLYFPPPTPTPTSPPPAVPRRSSARLHGGPLNSHPPPPPPAIIRPASSIYDGSNVRMKSMISSVGSGGGGGRSTGVGTVLSEYLDFHPQHLDGPWDPGQEEEASAVPRPLEPVGQRERRRQYLSVDVEHSPGGVDEVSPLSSSSSGPYMPARISAMSGLSPSSPVRTRSRRRI